MGYIGTKPSAVPLTSADIADGIITNADIANSTINLTTKVTGTLPVANGGTGLAALGTSLQVLRTNTGATALEYATLSTGAAAGQVIQVLGATDTTERTTTSSSFVTASNTLSVAITPASISNKFAIFVNHYAGSDSGYGQYTIARDGSNLGASNGLAQYNSGAGSLDGSVSYFYLDSPATTSSITYQAYMKSGTGTQKMGQANRTAQIIVMEIKG